LPPLIFTELMNRQVLVIDGKNHSSFLQPKMNTLNYYQMTKEETFTISMARLPSFNFLNCFIFRSPSI
jgi:hypothetical protein